LKRFGESGKKYEDKIKVRGDGMGPFRRTIQAIKRRPLIIWYFGIVSLIFCIIDKYNPIMTILFGLGQITKSDLSQGIISFLQIILDREILLTAFIIMLAFSAAAALVIGLVFSGYFSVINNVLSGLPKSRGELSSGLKKHFFKIFLIAFRVLFFTAILIVFMMVVTVPAVIITKAAMTEKPEFILAALFIDILTVCVVFFGFMFFRSYTLFWIPAAVSGEKKAFSAGKNFANNHFWGIVGRFIVFDLIFAGAQLVFMNMEETLTSFITNWIFTALFFSFFATYIFSLYKTLRRR
jgi:hypothetical protein